MGKIGFSLFAHFEVGTHVLTIERAVISNSDVKIATTRNVMAQTRLRRPAINLMGVACCLALSTACNAECRKAQEAEFPHGANELIELKEQTVKRVFGTISIGFGNSDPTPNVVVEVYRSTANQDFQKTIEQKRLTACVTGPDGKFAFPELGSGRYLLRVGMRDPAGINETYVPIILKSSRKGLKGRGIRIALQLGT